MNILLPLFYLPPVEWFSKLINCDQQVILEAHENFPKQTFRNRANIYGANGKLSLIIPVRHTAKRLFKETEISYSENWQSLHYKSVKTAYQSSPYFEFYEDRLIKIFERKEKFLFDFNLHALQIIMDIMKVEKSFTFTETFQKEVVMADLRDHFSTKKNAEYTYPEYYQVFSDKMGFLTNLSIIDLICNKGPESLTYIHNLK